MSYSLLDLACDVLRKVPTPMTYQEIWQFASDKGLSSKLDTTGKTPWQSLGSRLYVDVRDNAHSRFIPVGKNPVRFFLKERQSELPPDIALRIQREAAKKAKKERAFHERELHPVLTYFADTNLSFNRGRPVHTRTIMHEKSTKSGYSSWTHPDMVGFYLPFDDWQLAVFELNRLSDNNSLRMFSFEIKIFLDKTNYRESYFQAVSNSSWAHEGYLVATDILQEDEFLAELERLSLSFGVGIIHLDLTDVYGSRIIFPARVRETLDWETINKLCEQNGDFEKFLRAVKIDFEARQIHPSEYDKVDNAITEYIAEKLGIKQKA